MKNKIFRQGVSCRSSKCKYYKTLIHMLTETDEYPSEVAEHCQTCKRCWYDKFEPKGSGIE